MTFQEGTNLRATTWGDSSVKIINLLFLRILFPAKTNVFFYAIGILRNVLKKGIITRALI